jgi:hypothetical protein
VSDLVLLAADLIQDVFSADEGWGLYRDDGGLVVSAETFASVDPRAESRLCNHPVEEGGFDTYNKVDMPFRARITFAQGGSVAERSATLDSLRAALASLDLCSLVMPEGTFVNLNVTAFDMSRKAVSGRGILIPDVLAEEVRIVAGTTYAPAQDNAAAADANNGTVAPASPLTSTTSATAAEAPGGLAGSSTTPSATAADGPFGNGTIPATVPEPGFPSSVSPADATVTPPEAAYVPQPQPASVAAPPPATVSNPSTGLLIQTPENYAGPTVMAEPQVNFSVPSPSGDLVSDPTGYQLTSPTYPVQTTPPPSSLNPGVFVGPSVTTLQ